MSSVSRELRVLLAFVALSALFGWPRVVSPFGVVGANDADAYTLLWLASASTDIGVGLRSAWSNWPEGLSLARADTWVVVALGATLGRVLHPTTIAWALGLLGPALSAWAAERLARRELGVPLPWSFFAGLGFGFTGLCASGLRTGQVYGVLVPWLPLLAGALMRLGRPEAKVRDGVFAAIWWGLCLLTSAYLGLAASVLALIFVIWALPRRPRPGPLAMAAAIAVPLGIVYVLVFASGGAGRGVVELTPEARAAFVSGGSATLVSLAAWTHGDLALPHRLLPVVPLVPAVLAGSAPVVRLDARWRVLAILAVVGLLISLGPRIELSSGGRWWLPGPLAALMGFSFMDWIRLPVRFVQIGYLGIGLLGAMVGAELARRRPRAVLVLLIACGVDVMVRCRPPGPAVLASGAVPSAYDRVAPGEAVLELLPRTVPGEADLGLFLNNLVCYYQVGHHHPLVNPCLDSTLMGRPVSELSVELIEELLDDRRWEVVSARPEVLFEVFGQSEIGFVALHPLVFPEAERALLTSRLEQLLGAPTAVSRDGGEWVSIYELPDIVEVLP